MTCRTVTATVAMFLFLAAVSVNPAMAQQYIFRDIDLPGAGTTLVNGNNSLGTIVGTYQIAGFSSGYLGYLLEDGAFKTMQHPKADPNQGTSLTGVSNNGKLVVGDYGDSSGNIHGFLLVGKKYTSIDHSGATETLPAGVNDAGVVVGDYVDSSGYHGFSWQSGVFSSIDFPGASLTQPNAINDSGAVAGVYELSGSYHGFLLNSGTYTSIDYPGAIFTAAFGINNAGQIVGFYYNSGGVNHAFTDFSGTFSTLDYPGAFASALTGINDEGQVVGQWFGPTGSGTYNDEHGYLATPIPGTHDAQRENGVRGKASFHTNE